MKTMISKQLSGAYGLEFQANSFDEIAQLSTEHRMEMFQQNDAAHLEAMNAMRELMQKPEAMTEWFEGSRKEFDGLAESQAIR